MAQKFEFTDGVNTVELKYVINATGMGIPPIDIETTQAYKQDGVTVQSVTYQSRAFTLEFDIRGANAAAAEAERKKVLEFFGNKGAKTFTYTRNGNKYYLSPVFMAAAYDPDMHELLAQTGTAQFIAGNPYYKRDIPYTSVQTETPVFEVPQEGVEVTAEGIEFSTAQNKMVLVNSGGVVSPAFIRFVGPATTPYVENTTTNERIEVNREIDAGEELVINTEKHRVDIIDNQGNSHNAFNYIIDGSDFIHLSPGGNDIAFGAAGGTGYIEVGGIEYYAGV